MAMRFLAIVFLALISVGPAAADDLFTNNTMFMRVQCEIGEFAKDVKSADLDPAMKADIYFSWTVEESTKAKASGGWHWLFGGATVEQARGWQNKDKNEIVRTFNIHEDNTEACQSNRLKVPLGIKECLMGSMDALKAGTNASCERSRSIGVNTNASGEVTLVKVIQVKGEAVYDVTTTYITKVSAPAKPQEQKKASIDQMPTLVTEKAH
jgi:hypothetical protein